MNESRSERLAQIGALLGHSVRAAILDVLLDGAERTATGLAAATGAVPSTASGHLAALSEAGMLTVRVDGRRRWFSLAGPEVAQLVEVALAVPGPPLRTPPPAFTMARTCYDHLAGKLGVAIANSLSERQLIVVDDHALHVTSEGGRFLESIGVAIPAAHAKRRYAFACTDYTERRPHIAGALGAAIATTFMSSGWVRRVDGTRMVEVTDRGRVALQHYFR